MLLEKNISPSSEKNSVEAEQKKVSEKEVPANNSPQQTASNGKNNSPAEENPQPTEDKNNGESAVDSSSLPAAEDTPYDADNIFKKLESFREDANIQQEQANLLGLHKKIAALKHKIFKSCEEIKLLKSEVQSMRWYDSKRHSHKLTPEEKSLRRKRIKALKADLILDRQNLTDLKAKFKSLAKRIDKALDRNLRFAKSHSRIYMQKNTGSVKHLVLSFLKDMSINHVDELIDIKSQDDFDVFSEKFKVAADLHFPEVYIMISGLPDQKRKYLDIVRETLNAWDHKSKSVIEELKLD
jgi:hypothetical protein